LLAINTNTTTMKLTGLLATTAVAANQAMAADFTNSFESITSGSTITLSWDGVQEEHYPLYITAQVIDKGGDGFSANAYRVNITSMSLLEQVVLGGRSGTALGLTCPLLDILLSREIFHKGRERC
jgi:hypothetical protein